MRDYGKVASTFWTGETGRAIRHDQTAQIVALYLMTAPTANMIGLYYLPVVTIAHETGSPFEGASKALRSLCELGFCSYDEASEVVFVRKMARFQIGEEVKASDKRHKAILKELERYQKTPFYAQFYEEYGKCYYLPKPRGFEAPSKPLRSQKQKQEQKQEQEQEQEQEKNQREGDTPSPPSDVAKASRPRNERFDAIAEITGLDPATAGDSIGRVAASLAKADPPYTPDEIREFGRRFRELCPWAKGPAPAPGLIKQNIGLIRSVPGTSAMPSQFGDEIRKNGEKFLKLMEELEGTRGDET